MAVFRAWQATDMRLDLWNGIVVERGRFAIVATDGFHVSTYGGLFTFPYTGLVSGYTPVGFDALDPFGLGPVSGTLTSYSQDLGRLPQFDISQFGIAAATVFQAVRLGDPGLASALLFAGGDIFFGSRAADVLRGFAGNDTLNGNAGDDRLIGDIGFDNLFGADGNDILRGGGDLDRLYGGDGSDLLLGDAGRDFLDGNADSDTFRYLAISDSPAGAAYRDTILKFTHIDLIDLTTIDANALARGDQPFVFIGSAAFTDTPGQLRYTQSSHILSGDTDGDGDADFQIDLANAPALTAADLLL